MWYGEIFTLCSEIHTEHINTLCGQDIEMLNVKLVAHTGCPRRKGPNFGRVFLMSNYTDITQNTYIQSSMVTEILAREV